MNPLTQMSQLMAIRSLIDSLLADKPVVGVQNSLYTARLHMTQAIRELAATDDFRRIA